MYNYKHEYFTWIDDEGKSDNYTVITAPNQTTEKVIIWDDHAYDVSNLTEVYEFGDKYGEINLRSDEAFDDYIENYFDKAVAHLKDTANERP
jgi:hypothetical protein